MVRFLQSFAVQPKIEIIKIALEIKKLDVYLENNIGILYAMHFFFILIFHKKVALLVSILVIC